MREEVRRGVVTVEATAKMARKLIMVKVICMIAASDPRAGKTSETLLESKKLCETVSG